MSEDSTEPLEALAHIDPEALSASTSARFAFHYIDISAAAEGRLSVPRGTIEFAEAPSRARRIVRNGDVIISTVRPNLKAFAYCSLDDAPHVASTGFAVLRAREGVDPRFLLYALLSDDVSRQIDSHAVGSNYPAINSSDVRRLNLPRLSTEAQRDVASVLGSIDTTITQTEALIAKYQQIKAGLMHDLFTRGVLPNGQLRPPREQAPHLYKQTELGWVPGEWQIGQIRDCGEVKLGRQRSPDQHSGAWTRPYLRVANVYDGFIDFSDVLEMDFTPAERKTFSLVKGDILLNEGQSLELVGRSAMYRGEDHQFCFQNTLVRFRCAEQHNPFFFEQLFKLWLDTGRFQTVSKQTTSVAHLGADRFAKMACPVVPLAEQHLIGSRLAVVNERIAALCREAAKLQKQKLGLMQDLLTGKVQVPAQPTA
jgi:type I restriction enzyme, S subunit